MSKPLLNRLGNIMVIVVGSHSCDQGSSLAKTIHIRYALNNIQFQSDKYCAKLVLYLQEKLKCITPATF